MELLERMVILVIGADVNIEVTLVDKSHHHRLWKPDILEFQTNLKG